MVDKVSSAEVRAKLDPSGFEQGAKRVETSANSMNAAVDKVAVTTEKAGKNAAASAEGFQRFLAKLDPGVRMGQEYAHTMEQLDRYQKAGVVSANDLAIAHEGIAAKFHGSSAAVGELGGMFGFAQEAAAPFMALLSVDRLLEFGKEVFANAAALDVAADRTGLTTEAIQVYRAELKLAGIANEDADTLLAKFTKTLGVAELETGKSRDALVKLGLSAKDIAAGPESALPMVAKGLLDISDRSRRAAEETELFGRAGQKLDFALQDLSRSYADNAAEAKRLGLVMSDDVADQAHEAAEKFEEAWSRIEVAFTPVATKVASGLASIVEALENWHPVINIRANLGMQSAPVDNSDSQSSPSANYSRFGFWGGHARNGSGPGGSPASGFDPLKENEWLSQQREAGDMASLPSTERAAREEVIERANKRIEDGNRLGADGLLIEKQRLDVYKESYDFLGKADAEEARRLGVQKNQSKELKEHNSALERANRLIEQQVHALSSNAGALAQIDRRIAELMPGSDPRDTFIGNAMARLHRPQNLDFRSKDGLGRYDDYLKQYGATSQQAGTEYDLGLYNKSLSLVPEGASGDQAKIRELNAELEATRRLAAEFPDHAGEFNSAIANIENALRKATIAADPLNRRLDQLSTSLSGDISHGVESAVFSGNPGKAGKELLLGASKDIYKSMIGDPLEKSLKSGLDKLFNISPSGKPDGTAFNPLHVIMAGLGGGVGSSTSIGGVTGNGGGSLAGIFSSLFSSGAGNAGIAEAGKGAASAAASSDWFSSLFSSFAGMFADGGSVPPGQWGIAGENGPEPIFGGSTGVHVVPNYEAGASHETSVHIYMGNIDARGSTMTEEQFRRIASEESTRAIKTAAPVLMSGTIEGVSNKLRNSGRGRL